MTAPPFQDHFAPVAASYATFRPTYPAELFRWLASITPSRERVWDCACGSGQASRDLTHDFHRVIATDASPSQIAAAAPHDRIDFRVAPAEASGLDDHSVDLITVAQALHWFNLPAFYAEAARVAKPGGILAVWSYGPHTTQDPAVHALVHRFSQDVVGPCWPPERRLVEEGYRSLPFPAGELATPSFTLTAQWNRAALMGYLRSWSATGNYQAQHGIDPVQALEESLADLWPAQQTRVITWPLALRAARLG